MRLISCSALLLKRVRLAEKEKQARANSSLYPARDAWSERQLLLLIGYSTTQSTLPKTIYPVHGLPNRDTTESELTTNLPEESLGTVFQSDTYRCLCYYTHGKRKTYRVTSLRSVTPPPLLEMPQTFFYCCKKSHTNSKQCVHNRRCSSKSVK